MRTRFWGALLAFAITASSAQAFDVCIDPGAPIAASTGQIALNAPLVKATGAKYARLNFILGPWSSPTDTTPHGPGNLTWKQTYDQIVNSLISQGIQVYALIGAESVKSSATLNTDQYITDLTRNAVSITGMFKDRVKVYEIFNEPNDWAGGTTAQYQPYWYAKLLQEVWMSVKVRDGHSTDPSWQVKILSGPLFSHDQDTGASYMSQVYTAGKTQLDWTNIRTTNGSYPLDGIAYHLYVAQGPSTEATVTSKLNENLNAIWGVIASNEGANTTKKLWISEMGWTSDAVSEAEQARNVTLGMNTLKANPHVSFGNWFCLMDFGPGARYGIVKGWPVTDATKKPAWDAFVSFARAETATATISGTVKDNTGATIASAKVSTDKGDTATANSSGFYTLAVPPGSYTLTAECFGYTTQTRTTTVADHGSATVDFTLTKARQVSGSASIKSISDGTLVRLDGVAVTACFPDRVYVEDAGRACGIGVLGASAEPGTWVDVTGITTTVDGERMLALPKVEAAESGTQAVEPLALGCKDLGGGPAGLQSAVVNDATAVPPTGAVGTNNTGLLVTVTGRVTATDEGQSFFYLDDGSGLRDGSGQTGVRADLPVGCSMPPADSTVRVTGISGATRIGTVTARLLRARDATSIRRIYPDYQFNVANAGFEDGTPAGWTTYGDAGGVQQAPWFAGITAWSGDRFFGCAADGTALTGGLWQQVVCEPGLACHAEVYSCVYRGSNTENAALSRVGIDPTGGTDPAAQTVVWSVWDSQAATYQSEWRLLTTPVAACTGDRITLFLDFQQSEAGWHINCFDDAMIALY